MVARGPVAKASAWCKESWRSLRLKEEGAERDETGHALAGIWETAEGKASPVKAGDQQVFAATDPGYTGTSTPLRPWTILLGGKGGDASERESATAALLGHLRYMWALPSRRACPDPDLQGLGSLPRLVNPHFAVLADGCQAASIGAPGQAEDLKAQQVNPRGWLREACGSRMLSHTVRMSNPHPKIYDGPHAPPSSWMLYLVGARDARLASLLAIL